MKLTFAVRYLLGCALGVVVLALVIAAPAVAATGPIIVEQRQAAELPPGSIPADSWLLTESQPFTSSSVEHYTRTVGCGWRHFHYVARCLSLVQAPPAAGSTALYDPEGWLLTSKGERAAYCAGMRLAANLIRSAGAVPVIAPPSPGRRRLVECAARNADTIVLQVQPLEADTAAYVAQLDAATGWARAENPAVAVVFVLSTNPKYGATAEVMAADYQMAEQVLGGSARCWLNVIPQRGDYAAAAGKATRFLGRIG